MAKGKLEARLTEVARLRSAPDGDGLVEGLRTALGDRSNHVVAKAANIVGARELGSLKPELEAAFERFLVDPGKTDKGCIAKTAIAQALDSVDAIADAAFLRGVRHIQTEPVSRTQSVDTAAGLRVRCCSGLIRMRHPAGLDEAIRLLVDPEADARIGACQALAGAGRVEAESLLRLKALSGDRDETVLEACFDALIALEPERSVGFVAEFLTRDDLGVVEAAAMALGGSRHADAIEPLRELALSALMPSVRRTALGAIAMLRLEPAVDALVELVRSPRSGLEAVSALAAIYRDDRVGARVREAAEASGDADLCEAAREAYPD